jgi:hypothetical protein
MNDRAISPQLRGRLRRVLLALFEVVADEKDRLLAQRADEVAVAINRLVDRADTLDRRADAAPTAGVTVEVSRKPQTCGHECGCHPLEHAIYRALNVAENLDRKIALQELAEDLRQWQED